MSGKAKKDIPAPFTFIRLTFWVLFLLSLLSIIVNSLILNKTAEGHDVFIPIILGAVLLFFSGWRSAMNPK